MARKSIQTIEALREKILKKAARSADTVIERRWKINGSGIDTLTVRNMRRGEPYNKGMRRIENGYIYEMADIVRKEDIV